MKSRLVVLALLTGGLTLSILSSAPGGAAPPAAEKPSAGALINIKGGTAITKKVADGEYRIFLPQGVTIAWMGEVEGEGTRTGTMGRKGLVAGWAALGHRNGTHTQATVTWEKEGSPLPLYRSVYIAKPRINPEGKLTFLAKTQLGAPLPKTMANFSLNISLSVQPEPRSYSVFGANQYFDGTQATWVNATVTDVNKALAYWVNGDPTKPCSTLLLAGNGQFPLPSSFTCGGFTIGTTTSDGKASYGQITPPPSTSQTSVGTLYLSFSITPTNSTPFDFKQQIAAWQRGGTAICPATDSSYPPVPCVPAT